jgi:hypothetical protein
MYVEFRHSSSKRASSTPVNRQRVKQTLKVLTDEFVKLSKTNYNRLEIDYMAILGQLSFIGLPINAMSCCRNSVG